MARHRASAADGRANGGPSQNGASANGHPTTNGYRKSFPGNGRVLVLNASFEPINVCTVRRAAVLVLKDKAVLLERAERPLRSERLSLDRPTVIRLISFVRIPATPTAARSPARRCWPATPGPVSTAARANRVSRSTT